MIGRPRTLSGRLGRICALGLLATLGILAPVAAGAAASSLVHLVDDRGAALDAPVQVCFVRGLGTDCADRGAGAGPLELRPFDVLRIEGPDHGPVTVRPGGLPATADGVVRITVPRKATLRVARAASDPLSAALFPLDGLDPAHPAHRLEVPAEGDLKVPAGDWLLALEGRGLAPDLHLLAAPPGATRRVRHRAGPGWSLVLRVVAKGDEAPVASAQVTVQVPEPAPRRDRPESGPAEAEEPERHTGSTGPAGLALVSGIEAPLVEAEIAHPDFVAATEPGLSSSPGSLEVRKVALGRGAVLEATIRVEGEPARGWSCRLLDREAAAMGRSREVLATEAGTDGVCRAERVPEGAYWLRVGAEAEDAETGVAEREVRLYDGETATIAFDLSLIPVEGEVRRGAEGVAEFTVQVFRESETGSTNLLEPVGEAVTGDEGLYATTVWDPGPYVFMVLDLDGRSAGTERAEVERPAARVDVELAGGEVEGVVVDEDGAPVAQASIEIDWRGEDGRSMSSLRASDDGTFRVSLQHDTGTLTLTAQHEGFRPGTASFALAEGTAVPPVVLTLRRGGFLEGQVVSAAGGPAAGTRVTSYRVAPDGTLERKGSSVTGAAGSFQVLPAEPPPTRLFAAGPACPLTAIDVAAAGPPIEIACPAGSGTILLQVRDGEGRPAAGEYALLRRGGVVVPLYVLAGHLHQLGQSFESDGSGRLALPGLGPGTYDVYLASRASEALVAQGSAQGYVGTVTVGPGETAALEAVVDTPP